MKKQIVSLLLSVPLLAAVSSSSFASDESVKESEIFSSTYKKITVCEYEKAYGSGPLFFERTYNGHIYCPTRMRIGNSTYLINRERWI
ncbi:hypothetical protein [Pseudoalteromonas luteoviolacea]|uniref:Uncharacterized protein n=1 Tax=Pseudoalteromonas luteoviolacea H33 TaxID=1365251 RepID=A0A162AHR6_9GAMM|nr:hypothetical protein [Pseudoalteromonas luteoviolacea]KZN50129.1 hypothetical protein N476_17430 [Pseudoalteromonas luteoviolacea H33]KZN76298.1 hypothetical protein N477_16460 [Pseudoalteromonas luteoviolacea H33-S]